jgi:hypothetical protein
MGFSGSIFVNLLPIGPERLRQLPDERFESVHNS